MNQTYFEWYEFDVNVLLILIVLILINQHCTEYEFNIQYNTILLTHLYSKFHEFL